MQRVNPNAKRFEFGISNVKHALAWSGHLIRADM